MRCVRGPSVRGFVALVVVSALGGPARRSVADEPPKKPDPVQTAIDELAATAAETRAAAATRLGAAWPAGTEACSFLAIALRDEDARVREAAAGAIRALAE